MNNTKIIYNEKAVVFKQTKKRYYAATDSLFGRVCTRGANRSKLHWTIHTFNSKTDRYNFLTENVNGTSLILNAKEAQQIIKAQEKIKENRNE